MSLSFYLQGEANPELLERVDVFVKQLRHHGSVVAIPKLVALDRLQQVYRPVVELTYHYRAFVQLTFTFPLDSHTLFTVACVAASRAIELLEAKEQ